MRPIQNTGSWRGVLAVLILVLLAACSTGKRSGGYYKDDGPESNPPSNLDRVPDAVPKNEPLARGANKPYTVLGRSYTPDTSGKPYRIQGRASWYGKKFHGNSTSNGERYDMYAMTAAHPTLPIPSYVRVTRLQNNKSVVLRINDRGPFHSDRVIDLSYVAAYKLGMLGPGSTEVVVERIMPDQMRNWQPAAPSSNVAVSEPSPPKASPPRETLQAQPLAPVVLPSAAPPPVALQPVALPAVALPAVASPPVDLSTRDIAPAVNKSELAADNVAPKPLPANAVAVPPNAMFLQLGAFSEQAKAQSLATLVAEQLPTHVNAPVLIDRSASNLYRVRIGPFASREAAVQAVSPVSSATGINPSLSLP